MTAPSLSVTGVWSPQRQMQRDMARLGGAFTGDAQGVGGGAYPPVNVYNSDDDMVVQFELPGLSEDDLDVSVTGETLVIKGTKRPGTEDENVRYHRRERGSGEFTRTIVLPDKVDADKVEANLQAGILEIRLPKSEAARPRQIALGKQG